MYYDTKKSGARIRQLRMKSGLTQEKTAEALKTVCSVRNMMTPSHRQGICWKRWKHCRNIFQPLMERSSPIWWTASRQAAAIPYASV